MPRMQIDRPDAYRRSEELPLLRELLPLADARVVELGCGAARLTRLLAEQCGVAAVIATEVDRIQHRKNLAIDDLPQVEFRYGGAEAIDQPDASVDITLMLKSLHHVPRARMGDALREIHRVLRPGGLAYFSEPVYRGALNEIMRLYHDERDVREAAFAALCGAVDAGLFELVEERFIETPLTLASFAEFERRFLGVTHTRIELEPALYARVKAAFEAHLGADGARFDNPLRIDLLRKPA